MVMAFRQQCHERQLNLFLMSELVVNEIGRFKEHIELYEMMIHRAKKSALDEIMPSLKSLREEVAEITAERKKAELEQLLPKPPDIMLDLFLCLGLGITLALIALMLHRKGILRINL